MIYEVVTTEQADADLWGIYDNFCKALNNLKDIYDYAEPYDNAIATGLVGLYRICFEQSWKVMKKCLEESGYDLACTGSPRQIIKTAYKAGMINDADAWLRALVSINDVAHSYNIEVALDIINSTKEEYYNMFNELKEELEKNWIVTYE